MGKRPEVLLNTLQCKGPAPQKQQQQNDLAYNVSNGHGGETPEEAVG